MSWRFLVPAAVFGALLWFFYRGLGLNPGEVPSPLLDKPAPRFELASLRQPDQRVSSDDLKGQVSLLNVWATWCVGCRQEHEVLLEIARSGVVPIYSLNWKDDRDLALAWLDQLGDPYVATAVDHDGRVAIDWGVYGAPETFLVDREGIVRYKHIGPLDLEVWRTRILPLVEAAQRSGS